MLTKRLTSFRRFSLRMLFVLMSICCLLLGLWSVYIQPFRDQAQALAVVNKLQGEAILTSAPGPAWQRWLVTVMLGEERFIEATQVSLAGRPVDDETLRSLAGLIHVRDLNLDGTEISDNGMAALRSMKDLDSLSLRYTNISDRAIPTLSESPKLRELHLTGTRISDKAVETLAKLHSLRQLFIRWTRISDNGAQQLRQRMANCRIHHHALVEESTALRDGGNI
jgi:Leucine Rich repeat